MDAAEARERVHPDPAVQAARDVEIFRKCRKRMDGNLQSSVLLGIAEYQAFIERKGHIGDRCGFKPTWMPDFLFDFQASLVEWAIWKGRSGIFADCGLGKTPMQLIFAENVVRHTNKPVLILTPLAVADQTVQEAEKFSIEAHRSKEGKLPPKAVIVITNYERLHYFDPTDFSGCVCDESSILKDFDGQRRGAITEFVRRLPYRLLCTATAAPNDYTELGTSSEALGDLGHMDMLARFFKNDNKTIHLLGTKHGKFSENKWQFKAHAETHFWRWVCSWARACRKPSDLGFDDGQFHLPRLIMRETTVKASRPAPGMLFEVAAETMAEQREESRRTISERCEAVAELLNRPDVDSAVAWCQLNAEGDVLAELIPDSVQIAGGDSDDAKEEAFRAFASGEIRKLVTKPAIGAWGLNWQHCNRMTFFPSHSFERFYQSVRRCWRFGQKRDVHVDIVATEGDAGVVANLRRKQAAADLMFSRLVELMNQSIRIGRSQYGNDAERIPVWLS